MTSEIRFDGQVAIVSGAGHGLGRTYALDLGRRGAKVVVNDIDLPAAGVVVEEIADEGGTAIACDASAGSFEGTAEIVRFTLDVFGDLDVLINNAAYFRSGFFEDLEREHVENMFAVSLFGYFWLTQNVWPIFQRKGYGRVVMTSSAAGMFGNRASSHYAATKAGAYGLTRVLSLEGEPHGIKVNCVLPSGRDPVRSGRRERPNPSLQTDMGDVAAKLHGRTQPELASHLVTYLASRDCPFTGYAFHTQAASYRRVYVGVSNGWLAETTERLSAEAIRDHIDEITDLTTSRPAGYTADELNALAASLAQLDD